MDVWNENFPHVKIREYKACSGKCNICSLLSLLMKQHKSFEAMKHIKAFRALHRGDFMGDRILYKRRVLQSVDDPVHFLSIITDGMQQFHTELPYYAGMNGTNRKVKQHLQGLTTHGKRTRMYRTVDHIKLGGNLCIYVLLLALEEEFKASLRLQRTLYIQLDGGPENANYALLGWMELLIAFDLGITEITASRMRVGHTHADQDARFGQLWLAARNAWLTHPTAYAALVETTLKKDYVGGAKLIDLFVIPDMTKAIESCLDPKLRWAFKGPHTQLVFRFQKVEKSAKFPLGCKCTYRASSLDEFIEFIEEGATSPTGLAPREVSVQWLPLNGMSFLTKMPDLSNVRPQPFVDGVVDEMLNNIAHIKRNKLIKHSTEIINDWNQFIQKLPRRDETADLFVERTGGMHIPFIEQMKTTLFTTECIKPPEPLQNTSTVSEDLKQYFAPKVAAGASLRWRECLKPEAPRVNIADRSDAAGIDKKQRQSRSSRFKFYECMDNVAVGKDIFISLLIHGELISIM